MYVTASLVAMQSSAEVCKAVVAQVMLPNQTLGLGGALILNVSVGGGSTPSATELAALPSAATLTAPDAPKLQLVAPANSAANSRAGVCVCV